MGDIIAFSVWYILTCILCLYMLGNASRYINKMSRLVNFIMAFINTNSEVPKDVKDELNEIYLGLTNLYDIELEDKDE